MTYDETLIVAVELTCSCNERSVQLVADGAGGTETMNGLTQ